MSPQFDDEDEKIRKRNLEEFNKNQGPRVGDFVIFSNNIVRRISYIYYEDDEMIPVSVQTSDSGSWYLAFGYCSFSGSLYNSIEAETLSLSKEIRNGFVWFFHHDYSMAHNGVETTIPFRVYNCSRKAPQ